MSKVKELRTVKRPTPPPEPKKGDKKKEKGK